MGRVIGFMLAVAAGLGLLLYPQASQWYQETGVITRGDQHTEAVAELRVTDRSDLLKAADAYNAALNQITNRYFDAAEAAFDADYQAQLRIGNNPIIGEVTVPAISIRLPIYHGTSDRVLQNGAGHLYGTSLPVGGANTHAVLSAHSGQTRAEMFRNLDKVAVGDDIFIDVSGQRLRYVVDQINVVLPHEIEYLQVVPGEDYLTLLTCTPTGLNTHRLLVRGIRTPLDGGELAAIAPPFPWWAVLFGAGMLLAGLFCWITNRKKKAALDQGSAGELAPESITPELVTVES